MNTLNVFIMPAQQAPHKAKSTANNFIDALNLKQLALLPTLSEAQRGHSSCMPCAWAPDPCLLSSAGDRLTL